MLQLLTAFLTIALLLTIAKTLLQEFLLEVQTSGGGTDVSGLALILAQQLGQRRDEEAALLTALRCV